MISPLPNTIVSSSRDDRQQPNPIFVTNSTAAIPKSPRSDTPVSFGHTYHDMQQVEHFKNEYYHIILNEIPPLVNYQPPKPSRVGVIPSSVKRSPLILPSPSTTHETTTLTRKLEPTKQPSKKKTAVNKSVFSGPHYVPEKYSIKPVTTFRQTYFVPNSADQQQSRYYVTPHINQYFQAALQDGSYFEAYPTYNASDPVNFRHAYKPQNSLDPITAAIVKQSNENRHIQPASSSSFSLSSQKQQTLSSAAPVAAPAPAPAPARRWHRPIASFPSNHGFSESDDEDDDNNVNDSDGSFKFTTRTPKLTKNKGKAKAKELPTIMDIDPPPPPELQPKPKRKSPITPIENTKKRKISNAFIPTKKAAIEELRQLGKFIKTWKHKDAEVCCVCYEDVTTQSNPLVYCDNGLCEVIVHKNCYKIRHNIANAEHWYCERCKPVDEVSVYRHVVCAVCPSITGAFCKLSEPFRGIEWIHMICAKMLTGPGGFIYQPKTQDYRMLFKHHIPIERFISQCVYCQDVKYAEFGAKIKCQYCIKYFHVTCAERTGHWCFNKDAVLACSEHAIHTTTKTSPKRLALVFEKWILKRAAFFDEEYDKTTEMTQVDTWKKIIVKNGGTGGEQEDAMDKSYTVFFDRIQNIQESPAKKQYANYLECLLNEFCRKYSSSHILSVHGLFLKKNFYHSVIYGYVASPESFYMCGDDEEEPPKPSSSHIDNRRKKPFTGDSITFYGNQRTIAPKKLFVYSSSASDIQPDSKSKSYLLQPKLKPQPQQEISTPLLPPPTPKLAISSTSTGSTNTNPTTKETVVLPSPDLICFICNQHEFPQSTWNSFNFESDYMKRLEHTKNQRKVGHTGSGTSWDPRVFIQCTECHLKVHCGCPSPPIKKYPHKFESFVCIHCDTKGEEVNQAMKIDESKKARRGTTGINYKV